jgi:LPS O-antigen subunit length determinant protein (WzzB/FepE family)
MTDIQRLALVRTVHTAIYIVMVAAIAVLLYAGATGYVGAWLWVALALLAAESVVFLGNGMKCPLTALAVRYGAQSGYAFDTFLPEQITRHTFRFFGSLLVVGLAILALRWIGVLG